MTLLYGPRSLSFSNPRCRYPMSTSTPITSSPSSSVTIWMMPCIAGWEGPMFRNMCLVSVAVVEVMATSGVRCTVYGVRYTVHRSPYTPVDRTVCGSVLGRRTDERLSFTDGIVLAQRVPLELLVHEDAVQVRVAGESDAEHVPDFPLEPVPPRP